MGDAFRGRVGTAGGGDGESDGDGGGDRASDGDGDGDGDEAWVRASGDLDGSVATPAAAFDGDPSTAWTTLRSRPRNQWVEVVLPEPVTVDRIPLTAPTTG